MALIPDPEETAVGMKAQEPSSQMLGKLILLDAQDRDNCEIMMSKGSIVIGRSAPYKSSLGKESELHS